MPEAPTLAPPAASLAPPPAAPDVVRRALTRLDADDRAVLVLVRFGGMTAAEVADLLGVPRSKVHAHLRSGLRALGDAVRRTAAPAGPPDRLPAVGLSRRRRP